jgi:hypothetical protein
MGPHATLTVSMVREIIMTGTRFLGCKLKCCGAYGRHNEVAQVAFRVAWFKYELRYSGSTGSFDSSYVGISAKGNAKNADGQAAVEGDSRRRDRDSALVWAPASR